MMDLGSLAMILGIIGFCNAMVYAVLKVISLNRQDRAAQDAAQHRRPA